MAFASIVLMVAIPVTISIAIHHARIIWATLGSLSTICTVGVALAYVYLSGKEKRKYR